MNCCDTDQTPVCPCSGFTFPQTIFNLPGLTTLAYRVGDYTSFREALLQPLPGETVLSSTDSQGNITQLWRPGASGDLAVQMIEWWAYLADILTFYNERVANEAYLGTAYLRESVNHLIRLLGYRPRPGIGATGTLAALAVGPNPFTLSAGFQVQSKPGPGQQPQIFELTNDITITPLIAPPGTPAIQGIANVIPVPSATPVGISQDGGIVLAGTVSAVKVGDRVLLMPKLKSSATVSAVATVTGVTPDTDPLRNPITHITFDPTVDTQVLSIQDVTQYQLLRTDLFSQVWQYPASASKIVQLVPGLPASPQIPFQLQVDLASVVRSIKIGDPIVFEFLPNGQPPPQFGTVTKTTEAVWYANPEGYIPGTQIINGSVDPSVPPPLLSASVSVSSPSPAAVPIAMLHTQITFGCQLNTPPTDSMATRPSFLVRYGWKAVGNLIVEAAPTVGGTATVDTTTPSVSLQLPPTPSTQPLTVPANTSVLVQDVNGNGAIGVVDTSTTLHLVDPAPVLVPPLQMLFNLLAVTRGKTVANEVLGSGNPLVAGQDFTLQNSPVTYLQNGNSTSGDNYSSTVSVLVNGQEWTEVPSFYGQAPNATVYVTREDDQNMTHVVFGDGQNGALLPTGVNNVVASYRYGSGAASPAAGSLTVVLKPVPGLRSVLNPVAVGGGSDPDPPSLVKQLAPQSVLTFNRAVSVDDYQTIAAQAPGVVRAKAAVSFDPLAQRPRVTVWVGNDANAVAAAQAALVATADPNRLPRVVQAQAVVMTLSLTVVTDPTYQPQTVMNAVQTALLDPDVGLLGVNVVDIGQVFYDSQVYTACLAVSGVVAVHSLQFVVTTQLVPQTYVTMLRIGSGGLPLPEPVTVTPSSCCGQRHDPGEGAYLFLPDDASHFTLNQETAS